MFIAALFLLKLFSVFIMRCDFVTTCEKQIPCFYYNFNEM